MKGVSVLLIVLIAQSVSAQEIYKWKDDKGQWNFSQTPPKGSGEKTGFRSKPLRLPRDTPCTPFKIGEARQPISENPGVDSPVAFGAMRLTMLDGNQGSSRFAWKVVVKNIAGRSVYVAAQIKLRDCDLQLVASETSKLTAINAYQEQVLEGLIKVHGPKGLKVGRFDIELGMPSETKSQNPEISRPESKAEVVVVWSELRIGSGSEMWLRGRLYNPSSKPARNVRVIPNLIGKHGTRPPSTPITLHPSDIPPASFVNFNGRVLLFADADITANPTVEWNP